MRNVNSMADEMTLYLVRCYSRVHGQELDHKKRSAMPPMSEALAAARSQIINYTSLAIQGVFDPDAPVPKLPHSPLYKPLLDVSLPPGFILDLIASTLDHGWADFKAVFGPLLQCLVMEGRSSSIVDSTYRPSLIALTDLCDIKIAGSNRPICQLLTELVSTILNFFYGNFVGRN